MRNYKLTYVCIKSRRHLLLLSSKFLVNTEQLLEEIIVNPFFKLLIGILEKLGKRMKRKWSSVMVSIHFSRRFIFKKYDTGIGIGYLFRLGTHLMHFFCCNFFRTHFFEKEFRPFHFSQYFLYSLNYALLYFNFLPLEWFFKNFKRILKIGKITYPFWYKPNILK